MPSPTSSSSTGSRFFKPNSGAIIVEVIYRLLPVPLLLWLVSLLILRGRGQAQTFWVLAALTSLLEPASQDLSFLPYGIVPVAASFIPDYAFNFVQPSYFRRYGFLAAIVVRGEGNRARRAAMETLTRRLDRAEDYLRRRMAEQHIPAVALTVVERGEILRAEAYGVANLEWDAPTTTDTAFQLASATKLLTATLLMLLVEEGAIGLDVPIGEYLRQVPPAWRSITLRHLASHTSGIPDEVGPVSSVEAAAEAAARLPLEYEPGEKVRYGLNDYVVLARILEVVTGQPFPALLRERLLAPLGMTATRFDHASEDGPIRIADVVPHRASVYNWDGATQRAFAFLFPTWTYAAGGLLSSASDLARWAAALDKGKLLRPESLDQMWTRQRLNGGEEGPFGVGWIVERHAGRKVTGHSGGPALADVVRFVDESLTIAVLTNQQNLRPDLAMGVADVLLEDDRELA